MAWSTSFNINYTTPSATIAAQSASITNPSQTTSQPAGETRGGFVFGNGSGTFYRNLFYILIGLLATFIMVSMFTWWRGKLRQRIIWTEAQRLGLLVPGMSGYAAERERLLLSIKGVTVANGKPEIWDASGDNKDISGLGIFDKKVDANGVGLEGPGGSGPGGEWGMGRYAPRGLGEGEGAEMGNLWSEKLHPLAVIPTAQAVPLAAVPVSPLKFFPNNMAFRAPAPKTSPETILAQWTLRARHIGGNGNMHERNSYPPPTMGEGRAGTTAIDMPNLNPATPSAANPSPLTKRDKAMRTIAGGRAGLQASEPDPTSTPANQFDATKEIDTSASIAVLIRMPIPTVEKIGRTTERTEEEEEVAVQEEWEGLELGVCLTEVGLEESRRDG